MVLLRNCIFSFIVLSFIILPVRAIDLSVFVDIDEATINQYEERLQQGYSLDEIISIYYPELSDSSIAERNIAKLILEEIIFSDDEDSAELASKDEDLNKIINFTIDKAMELHIKDMNQEGVVSNDDLENLDLDSLSGGRTDSISDGEITNADLENLDLGSLENIDQASDNENLGNLDLESLETVDSNQDGSFTNDDLEKLDTIVEESGLNVSPEETNNSDYYSSGSMPLEWDSQHGTHCDNKPECGPMMMQYSKFRPLNK